MLRTRALHGHFFSRAVALALLLGTLALLAACDGANSAPSSTILLASAAQKLINDSAFHFVLTETNPGAPSGSGFDVRAAEGDFVAPNKLQAPTVTAYISPIGPISTGAIVIDNQAWYKNPLTGQYQDAGSLSGQFQNVATFLGPGLAAVLASLQNVSAPSNSSVNGVATWKISATVSSDKLSQLTNGEVTSGQSIPVQLYIGQSDSQLYQVVIPGKITSFDTVQTSRTIDLSKFNESVTINPPTS
jgi:hypothetical protein